MLRKLNELKFLDYIRGSVLIFGDKLLLCFALIPTNIRAASTLPANPAVCYYYYLTNL